MFTNRQLTKLIWPLVVEQILSISVGMFDTMMISYAGEAAMSGVSLVDMINNLLISIFAAVATGGAVIVSQYLGAEDKRRARRASEQLFLSIFVISVCISTGFILFRKPLLSLLFGSIEASVMDSALIYFYISALSFPALALFNSGAAIFRSMGNSGISMKVSLIMNVINIIGNAYLIYYLHMGAAGAALATLAARSVAGISMFVLCMNKNNAVYITIKELCLPDFSMIKRILHIAIPNGIENGLFQLGRVLVVSIIALFGTAQIAANAVANSLDSMGCIGGQAMNLAIVTVVGQCMGANDKDQAVFYTKKLWKITYVMMAVTNIVILVFLPQILKLFTLSPEAYHYSYILVFIHDGLAILMWPTAFVMPNALRAAGDVKFTMVIALISMFAFRIVFAVILGIHLGWGCIGVWVAMILDWIFRVIMYVYRFRSRKWLEFRVI